MGEKIRIDTKFQMRDWEQMVKFIAITHGENHVLKNQPLFDWFFLRNKNKEEANLIVAYEGEKLISLLGYIPTIFLWGHEKIEGAWMAHWMTLKEHRFGIGALLMKKITELFPIVAGQGASLMNQEIVTKMKFRFLEKIPKVVFIFNVEKINSFFNFCATKDDYVIAEKLIFPKGVSSITNENYLPNWDLYPSLRYGTLRDASYLNYRYIDYPFFNYNIFIEGEPNSPAVCIARIINTSEGIKVARIMEFFFPENDYGKTQASSLIKKCLVFFKSNKCDYIDYYTTSEIQINFLLDYGFSKENNGDLPSLLDPIDLSRRYQNLEVYIAPELKKRYPDSEYKFIVTRSDGDQDRPNQSYGKNGK